jgi:hypothetical protein
MKRLLLLVLILATATAASAAFDHSGWGWQRPIALGRNSGFVRLAITPEIFDQSQPGLNDLRVLDSSNSLVPHVVHWGRLGELRRLEWLPARLLNKTFLPEDFSRVTIDFQEMTEKNRIRVALSGENYRRRALLEGSNDSKTWGVVAEDLWLFHVSLQGQKFKLDTLKFPTNNFRYLRLTVYNMSDDPRRINIQSVKSAFYRSESKNELLPVPVVSIQTSADKRKKQSIFDLDLGFRNQPIVVVKCQINTPYFYRGYELLGRNQAVEKVRSKTESGWKTVERKVPWKSVNRGILHRSRYRRKINESVEIESINAPYRYLQLRVFNGDNPPLQLGGVSVFRRDTSLVFRARAGQTYRLIGGNSEARAADYDLAKAVRGVDEFSSPVVHPGPSSVLAAKKEMVPWSERHSVAILLVLIFAVGVMLRFIVKNLRGLPGKKQ